MQRKLILLGCYTSIASGILLMLGHLTNLLSGESVLGSTFVFFAHLLLVFAFVGLFVVQGEQIETDGFLALLFGIIGNTLVTAIIFVEIAQAAGEKVGGVLTAPVIKPMADFGPLLFILGIILLGISMIRGKVLPKIAGYFLVVGTLIFAVASMVTTGSLIIEMVGSIFTGAGFIIAGLKGLKPGIGKLAEHGNTTKNL